MQEPDDIRSQHQQGTGSSSPLYTLVAGVPTALPSGQTFVPLFAVPQPRPEEASGSPAQKGRPNGGARDAVAVGSAEFEAQAVAGFLRGPTADLIHKLYEYLKTHGKDRPELGDCIQIVGQAVALFGAGSYAEAFQQCFLAHRCITGLRTAIPDLPAVP